MIGLAATAVVVYVGAKIILGLLSLAMDVWETERS